MQISASREFDAFLRRLRASSAAGDTIARQRLTYLAAFLAELRELDFEPTFESPMFKLVKQARRHRIWRMAHPFNATMAVRLLVWFTIDQRVVVALVAFDKGKLGDIWYDSATVRAESAVDQWLREHSSEKGQQ